MWRLKRNTGLVKQQVLENIINRTQKTRVCLNCCFGNRQVNNNHNRKVNGDV